MKTDISIQLLPEQLITLRRGETINISISLKHGGEQVQAGGEQNLLPDDQTEKHYPTFLVFFQSQIARLKTNGNARTSETYQASYNKFRTFRQGEDLAATEIDGTLMEAFQSFLRAQGLSMNSISFYIRIIRAVYHRAVHEGMCDDCKPFTHVFTGSQTTAKRALNLKELQRIKHLELTDKDALFARDLFLFSFYTRGMSFVDLAYLKKEDVHNGMMVYIRRKTGQRLTMRWEKEMELIVRHHPSSTLYLLPIIHTVGEYERNQYRVLQSKVNRELKKIASKANIKQNLTMYCARHSWATIAREHKIPVSVISHAMGHTNEMMTEVYLKAIDSSEIDKYNCEIIQLLE